MEYTLDIYSKQPGQLMQKNGSELQSEAAGERIQPPHAIGKNLYSSSYHREIRDYRKNLP